MTDDITVQIKGGVSKYTDESIRDLVASFVTGGTDLDITHDDVNDVLTFDFTGTSYTAEAARDDIAAALDGGSGISVTYDDAADTITIDTSALLDGEDFDGQGTSQLSNLQSVDTERVFNNEQTRRTRRYR